MPHCVGSMWAGPLEARLEARPDVGDCPDLELRLSWAAESHQCILLAMSMLLTAVIGTWTFRVRDLLSSLSSPWPELLQVLCSTVADLSEL